MKTLRCAPPRLCSELFHRPPCGYYFWEFDVILKQYAYCILEPFPSLHSIFLLLRPRQALISSEVDRYAEQAAAAAAGGAAAGAVAASSRLRNAQASGGLAASSKVRTSRTLQCVMILSPTLLCPLSSRAFNRLICCLFKD